MAKARRSFFSHQDRARTLEAIETLRRCLAGVCAGHAFTHPAAEAARNCFETAAALETALIRERTSEGRKRAQDAGVRFGRPPALTPKQAIEAVRLAKQHGNSTAAEIMNVSVATIERLKARMAS